MLGLIVADHPRQNRPDREASSSGASPLVVGGRSYGSLPAGRVDASRGFRCDSGPQASQGPTWGGKPSAVGDQL